MQSRDGTTPTEDAQRSARKGQYLERIGFGIGLAYLIVTLGLFVKLQRVERQWDQRFEEIKLGDQDFFDRLQACEVGRVRATSGLRIATQAARPILTIVVVPVVGFCVIRGRRMQAFWHGKLALLDTRAAFLYLRSFSMDGMGTTSDWNEKRSYRHGPFAKTLEENLAVLLRAHGPCLTAARPGEKLPELGFGRISVQGEDWPSAIRQLMKGARLIILQPGHSPGVAGELVTALREHPERLILLIRSGLARSSRTRRRHLHEIVRLLEALTQHAVDMPDSRAVLVGFSATQVPCFYGVENPSLLVRYLTWGRRNPLRPPMARVLAQLGIEIDATESLRTPAAVLHAMMVVVMTALLMAVGWLLVEVVRS